ncbi:MAG: phosphate acyltransferase [Candidatus Cloacimonetes bacterium]|jgi:phosphate butyryltransferase|nr:phosphate acyltransferase [Candidatus Cloacimonadota bacterium]
MIKNFEQLLSKVKVMKNKTVVIAAAHTPSAIDAALMAKEEDIADSLLVGDKRYIEKYLLENASGFVNDFTIIDTGEDLDLAAAESVKSIREGKTDILLKGKCSTATLIKAVLDKETGLRTGENLSDVLVYEHPEKLVLLSDGGINLFPGVEEKVSIINNAVKVAHALDNPKPKVALLAAVEIVNPKMPATVDANIITEIFKKNQIKDCIVEGPLALDGAISKMAAKAKCIESEVAGNADVLIVPNIEAGNIFGKALTYYCNFRVAHVVMGAKVPIIIASRVDAAETKMLSMALGVLSAK